MLQYKRNPDISGNLENAVHNWLLPSSLLFLPPPLLLLPSPLLLLPPCLFLPSCFFFPPCFLFPSSCFFLLLLLLLLSPKFLLSQLFLPHFLLPPLHLSCSLLVLGQQTEEENLISLQTDMVCAHCEFSLLIVFAQRWLHFY